MAHGHPHDHAHGHGHDHAHDHADKRRVLVAACLTGGFMVVEAVGGWLTDSLALMADAGHMLADALALGLAWYAFHLGERPATGRHTYGLGRVKPLVAYTNGAALFVVALLILYEAWQRFLAPPPVLGGPMLVVAALGLGINVAAFLVLHGGSRESLNMRGAILHVLGDLLGSVAAIAAAVVILATGWMPIDPLLSVVVALLILSAAWRLMREAAHVLLEGTPARLDRDAVARDIETGVPGVIGVHHMHVWSLDGELTIATLHVSLAEGMDAHRAVGAVKALLAARHGIGHATVETEYGRCADEEAGGDHGHEHGHDAPRDRRHYH